jgi:hypothetical protein
MLRSGDRRGHLPSSVFSSLQYSSTVMSELCDCECVGENLKIISLVRIRVISFNCDLSVETKFAPLCVGHGRRGRTPRARGGPGGIDRSTSRGTVHICICTAVHRGFKPKPGGRSIRIITFRVIPDWKQNQTAVSDTLRLLSDF